MLAQLVPLFLGSLQPLGAMWAWTQARPQSRVRTGPLDLEMFHSFFFRWHVSVRCVCCFFLSILFLKVTLVQLK